MNTANIYQTSIIKQDAKEGKMNKVTSLTKYIQNCIREHGTYAGMGDGYNVDINDFDTTDRKIILSYLLPASYYEEVITSPERINAEFFEDRGYIEMLIDKNQYEVYLEDQEEMRSYR